MVADFEYADFEYADFEQELILERHGFMGAIALSDRLNALFDVSKIRNTA